MVMSGVEIAVLLSAVLLAATVQNIVGFGFALLAVPLMVLALDAHDAVVISTFLGFGSSSLQAWNGRGDVQWALVRRLSLSAMLGIPLGLLIFDRMNVRLLEGLLGVGILGSVLVLVRKLNLSRSRSWFDIAAGILSGALSSSLSTNGPPLVFALQARQLPIVQFRATISSIFSISGLVTLTSFVLIGEIDEQHLVGVAASVPLLLLGIVIGHQLKSRVKEDNARHFVLILLAVAGLSALASSVLG